MIWLVWGDDLDTAYGRWNIGYFKTSVDVCGHRKEGMKQYVNIKDGPLYELVCYNKSCKLVRAAQGGCLGFLERKPLCHFENELAITQVESAKYLT